MCQVLEQVWEAVGSSTTQSVLMGLTLFRATGSKQKLTKLHQMASHLEKNNC